jgi:hypothetical protein
MEDPSKVSICHKFRDLAIERPLDLAAALTKFWFDEAQPESAVNIFLTRRDQRSAFSQAFRFEAHAVALG